MYKNPSSPPPVQRILTRASRMRKVRNVTGSQQHELGSIVSSLNNNTSNCIKNLLFTGQFTVGNTIFERNNERFFPLPLGFDDDNCFSCSNDELTITTTISPPGKKSTTATRNFKYYLDETSQEWKVKGEFKFIFSTFKVDGKFENYNTPCNN